MQLSADSGLINRRQARQQEDGKKQENTVLINTKAKDAAPLGSLRYKVQSLFFIIYLCIKPNFRHVRLRHAKELLSVDPKKFVYSGAVSYSLFQIFTFCPKIEKFLRKKNCENVAALYFLSVGNFESFQTVRPCLKMTEKGLIYHCVRSELRYILIKDEKTEQ